MENTHLKTIEFTTEKGGVKSQVRKSIKTQCIKVFENAFAGFDDLGNGFYRKAIAKDHLTGDIIYCTVDIKVGFNGEPKTRISKPKNTPVNVPDLF